MFINLAKKDVDTAVCWNGTNMEEIQDFVGSDRIYDYRMEETMLIITDDVYDYFELPVGWYLVKYKTISMDSEIQNEYRAIAPETLQKYFNII